MEAESEKRDPLWYRLRNAVHFKDWQGAEELLKVNPYLRSARDSLGETVLHFLAVENDKEAVARLHKKGFDINTQNQLGVPVIFEVAMLSYKELFVWMVDNGADLKILSAAGYLDKNRQSILDYLRFFEKEEMIQFLVKKFPELNVAH